MLTLIYSVVGQIAGFSLSEALPIVERKDQPFPDIILSDDCTTGGTKTSKHPANLGRYTVRPPYLPSSHQFASFLLDSYPHPLIP